GDVLFPRTGEESLVGENSAGKGGMYHLLLSSSSSSLFLPQSIADGRFWRYRLVAGGPRTDQLPDRYVPSDYVANTVAIASFAAVVAVFAAVAALRHLATVASLHRHHCGRWSLPPSLLFAAIAAVARRRRCHSSRSRSGQLVASFLLLSAASFSSRSTPRLVSTHLYY
ncbi:hypothetical protein BHM03_00049619, partial [Ensete ventricosum]